MLVFGPQLVCFIIGCACIFIQVLGIQDQQLKQVLPTADPEPKNRKVSGFGITQPLTDPCSAIYQPNGLVSANLT